MTEDRKQMLEEYILGLPINLWKYEGAYFIAEPPCFNGGYKVTLQNGGVAIINSPTGVIRAIEIKSEKILLLYDGLYKIKMADDERLENQGVDFFFKQLGHAVTRALVDDQLPPFYPTHPGSTV